MKDPRCTHADLSRIFKLARDIAKRKKLALSLTDGDRLLMDRFLPKIEAGADAYLNTRPKVTPGYEGSRVLAKVLAAALARYVAEHELTPGELEISCRELGEVAGGLQPEDMASPEDLAQLAAIERELREVQAEKRQLEAAQREASRRELIEFLMQGQK